MMKNLSKIKFLMLMAITMAASYSCIRDFPRGGSDGENGSVKLRISVPTASMPATRALAESDEWAVDVNDISVLMFMASGESFVGSYRGKVTSGPVGTGGAAATMELEVTLPLGGTYNLMVVANAGSILESCASSLVRGAPQADIEAALTRSMQAPGGWTTDSGNPASKFPMWGYAKGVQSGDFEADGTASRFKRTVGLVRMVAKVDVALSQSLAAETMAGDPTGKKFVLQSVRVYNFNKKGRLIPDTGGSYDWESVDANNLRNNQTPAIPSGSDVASNPDTEWIERLLTAGASALRGEIYLFEAAKGNPPSASADTYKTNPCVVIGGSYMGGSTTYYRIDFAKKVNDAWQYMPIMRNNSYSVTVSDVTAAGFGTPKEALESMPVNIEANVVDWVGGNDITTIVSNGVYMLGLSHEGFLFPKQSQTTASTINKLTIVTDFGGGWSANVYDSATSETTGNSGWLTLSSYSLGSSNYPAGTAVDLLTEAMDDGGPESRTAWIHVSAGNLKYKVRVIQTLSEPFVRITATDSDEEISKLDFPAVNAAPQSFKVTWSPAEIPLEIIRVKSGTEPFTWQDPETNSLTRLTAGGEFVFDNIDPDDYLAMFRTRGSYLIFVLPNAWGGVISRSINLNQGSRFESFNLMLAGISDPQPVPHTGTSAQNQRSITVDSYVTGIPEGSSETITSPIPWRLEYWDGTGWVSERPASLEWLTFDKVQGEGSQLDGQGGRQPESISITVAAATPVTAAIDMSLIPPEGTEDNPYNLSNATGDAAVVENTANCYIVSAPGVYSLPLVYGNAIANGLTNSDAYTGNANNTTNLGVFRRHDGNGITDPYIYNQFTIGGASVVWTENNGSGQPIVARAWIDGSGQNLVFEVPAANIRPGNAVVAVTDTGSPAKIMWSWHIWVTDIDVSTENVDMINGFGFMKVNLGWVNGTPVPSYPERSARVRVVQDIDTPESQVFTVFSRGYTGASTNGTNTYYQWGRKDPMHRSNHTSIIYSNNQALPNIGTVIQNPGTFYSKNTDPWDWLGDGYNTTVVPEYYNLWNAKNTVRPSGGSSENTTAVIKTVYDPSPAGFKMPPTNAFPTSGATWDGTAQNQGLRVATTGGENAFFPAVGGIVVTTGNWANNGTRGNYWTASPARASTASGGTPQWTSPGAADFEFNTPAIDYGYGLHPRYRGEAFPVRPVRE